MRNLTALQRAPWSIFDELESLNADVNRLLGGAGAPESRAAEQGSSWRRATDYPLMNVWSAADGLIIDVELPGVPPEDVDVSVTGDVLTLRGKVNNAEPGKGQVCRRRERPHGEFARTLKLPFRAETAAVKANCKDGVLRLTVPRSEEEKTRRIAIEAA